MLRKSLTPVVLLSFLVPLAAQALTFTPASPVGQLAHPPVTTVAVSPSAPQVVYASTATELFRSTDGGDTWIALASPAPRISQLAVDPTDSSIVYLLGQSQLYRSDDGGTTWKSVGRPLGSVFAAVRIDPREPSTLYVGVRCSSVFDPLNTGGVHKSTDRGETWVLLNRAVTCVDFLALDPGAPQRLFAGTANGVGYRTEDAGRTWQQASGELPVFDVVADPVEPSRRYGLGRGPAGDIYVHFVVSTDGGASWSRVPAEGLPPGGQQLAIDPTTRRLFLLGQSVGLYVSDDRGLHWRHVPAVPALFATPIQMAAAGNRLFVATSRGLHRLEMSDPDAPAVIHLGEARPLRLTVDRIALDPTDAATLYATGYEGHGILNAYRVVRSTDSGRTWERITAADDVAFRYMIAVDALGDLYAADRQTMWRFAKATQTWETWHVPQLPQPSLLLANPRRPGWLYVANSGWVGYSTDGGRTWTRIAITGSGFWSLAIAPNGSDLIGGNNEGGYGSSDGGVTWRTLWTVRYLETKSVAFAPSRPETVYRLTNPGNGSGQSALYRSDDGGATWTALRWPGEREWAMPIAVDPHDHRSLRIGLARSTDAGMTWTIEPSNTPTEITSVAYSPDGAVLYALTRDSSLWRATLRGPRRRAVR